MHVFVEANDDVALEHGVAPPLPGAFALMRGARVPSGWVLIRAAMGAGLAAVTEQRRRRRSSAGSSCSWR